MENAYKRNGKTISEEEARIIDDLVDEYGKRSSTHHDTDYYYKSPHGKPHTHIGDRHIYFHE